MYMYIYIYQNLLGVINCYKPTYNWGSPPYRGDGGDSLK